MNPDIVALISLSIGAAQNPTDSIIAIIYAYHDSSNHTPIIDNTIDIIKAITAGIIMLTKLIFFPILGFDSSLVFILSFIWVEYSREYPVLF